MADKGTTLATHEDKRKIQDKQVESLRILDDFHSFTLLFNYFYNRMTCQKNLVLSDIKNVIRLFVQFLLGTTNNARIML